MSAMLDTYTDASRINTFQNRAEVFSKQVAVLLGFFVPVSTFLTQVFLLLLIVSWFLAGRLKEKVQFILSHPVARMTGLFFGVFVIGTLYSTASLADRLWMLEKVAKLLYIPFLLPIMQEKKWRRAALFAFLSAMLLTLILSLLKIYAKLPIVINPRFSGAAIFKDTIFTNLMMAFASFMVGHLVLEQAPFLKRTLLGMVLATLIFYVFFMSIGRSGYVVFSVLWLLFAFQRLSFRGIVIGLLSLAIFLSLVYFNSSNFHSRWLSVLADVEQYIGGNSDNSVGLRLEFLNHTWQLSKERLWFGHGTGSFKEIYEHYAAMHGLMNTQNPHNEYINILFQLGVVGLTAFIGFFVFLFKTARRLPPLEKWFAQGIILAIATGCFANSWLMDFTSGYLFVMIIAFCFGALTLKKDF